MTLLKSFLIVQIFAIPIAICINVILAAKRRNKAEEDPDLNFRIGGVGIKNIDYRKAYEANKHIINEMVARGKKNE